MMDDLDRAHTIDHSPRRQQSAAESETLRRARHAFMSRAHDVRVWQVVAADPLNSNHLAEQAIRENIVTVCHHLSLDPHELNIYLCDPDPDERIYGGCTMTSDEGETAVVIHVTPGASYEDYARRLAHELRHVWQIANRYNPARHGITLEDDAEAYEDKAVERCMNSVRDFFTGKLHTGRQTPYYPYADRMASYYELPARDQPQPPQQPPPVREGQVVETSGEKTFWAFIVGALLGLWWGD